MIRYQIKMKKPGAILDGHGLIQKVIAPNGQHDQGVVVVYVDGADAKTFEEHLNADPWVLEFFAHSTDPLNVKVPA